MDDFADSYLRGETPIPCVQCNMSVKFADLLKTAKELNADCLATGHYIRREIGADGKAELHRAHQDGKDQSYFLFATTRDQLDYLRFPIGNWPKERTRDEAKRLGLITADKPESMDICFVPNGDYASVVKKMRPAAGTPGDIVLRDGSVVGNHDGIIHYTVGQRKGLGIGGGVSENNEPLFVLSLDAAKNQVVVGPKSALAKDSVELRALNWLIDLDEGEGRDVTVKLRSTTAPQPARITRTKTGATIRLAAPQFGISAGQAAVFYDGSRVLGGGWIASAA